MLQAPISTRACTTRLQANRRSRPHDTESPAHELAEKVWCKFGEQYNKQSQLWAAADAAAAERPPQPAANAVGRHTERRRLRQPAAEPQPQPHAEEQQHQEAEAAAAAARAAAAAAPPPPQQQQQQAAPPAAARAVDGNDRVSAFRALLPVLRTAGVPEEHIAVS